ncbi:Gfo/Idh/MocA family oxidoreductase [Shewanella baltica]|uniref:Gfo/Idh/MocA family protein n=1 Tax=Shewanella baltica TaxID=62322 RepID=UPI00217E65A7|nr:Gfo/Idh/MocA family oxidoreductase [Shewanella baltica]MCS6153480.1 Gfo/Idh/MocA family oxidoreductase [Shewanella baltica]
MYKRIRIGVLGCANIAIKSIIPEIISNEKYYKLIGVASRDKVNAEYIANKFSTKAFFDYDSLINHGEIDAIYIPLPNSLHYYWIKKALENNLHVLVEKSLACNLNDVTSLVELAERKKLVLMENFQFRFHEQLQYIKKVINDGIIGDIRLIQSSFGFPPFNDHDNIRYKKELGGGSLLDAGAYPLRITQEIIGDELVVESALLNIDPQFDVDIWGAAQLRSAKSNIISQVSFGFDNFYQCKIEVWGSKGLIIADRVFTAPSNYEARVVIKISGIENDIDRTFVDNHFKNMLLYFYQLTNNEALRVAEGKMNIQQAKVISEIMEINN